MAVNFKTKLAYFFDSNYVILYMENKKSKTNKYNLLALQERRKSEEIKIKSENEKPKDETEKPVQQINEEHENRLRKRKLSAYFIFMREEVVKLKSQLKNLSGPELLRLIGKKWTEIKEDPIQFKVYFDKAEEENKRIIKSLNEQPKINISKKKKQPQKMVLSKIF